MSSQLLDWILLVSAHTSAECNVCIMRVWYWCLLETIMKYVCFFFLKGCELQFPNHSCIVSTFYIHLYVYCMCIYAVYVWSTHWVTCSWCVQVVALDVLAFHDIHSTHCSCTLCIGKLPHLRHWNSHETNWCVPLWHRTVVNTPMGQCLLADSLCTSRQPLISY